MKKRLQRCEVLRRFATLVAALMMCAALCVPAFASNNAQWRKWVVVAERNMVNEMGTSSRYLQLSPYQNGSLYAATFTSHYVRFTEKQVDSNGASRSAYSWFYVADNFPDWWRSSIPLGNRSYVQIDYKDAYYSNSIGGERTPYTGNITVRFFDYRYRTLAGVFSDTTDSGSSGFVVPMDAIPIFPYILATSENTSLSVDSMSFSGASPQTVLLSPNTFQTLVYGWPLGNSTSFSGISVGQTYLTNLSSDDLIIGFTANVPQYALFSVNAAISFWVDANKLPAGLQVGDEFPADTDAFDEMREELIDQFPEASENIQNGKSTLTGWNDTETVDTDVASSAMSALNAMFQNLGSFLFIVSLMVFGAVVLRMFIKKAVDG